ncbi:hypothetical protein C6496_14105 [Candidatus Poribacteria bacterium]|nr:MAG: hypothetical protein C6496_14105 [Candidatus Poribacteria bacterium]
MIKKQLFSSIMMYIGCLLILLMSACGNDADDYDDPDPPIIEYTVFDRTLAEAVGKVSGETITPTELATVTHLTFPRPRDPGPSFEGQDIELLAHCINLKELNLYAHGIVDFSPLAGLTRLEWLNLSFTGLSDLEPLTGLVNLQKLDLSWNRVNDLTALAGLIQLKELNLRGNQISDITPLANLIRIDKLYLNSNLIVDLKPLVDNPGLVDDTREDFDWGGDTVTVSDNPLSEVSRNVYIPALQARGVNVRY